MTSDAPPLDHAAYCTDLVQSHDYDRWLTVLLADPADRRALTALYAFNHELAKVRETVSDPMVGEIRLQWWRDVLDGIAAGTPRDHPVVQELARLACERSLDHDGLGALIDARSQDLDGEAPATLEDMVAYAEATGGQLAKLAQDLCGGGLEEAARKTGTAWALIGLVRAFGFHSDMQRSFLPASELAAAGVNPQEVFRGEFSPELGRIIGSIADKAEDLATQARGLLASSAARRRQKAVFYLLPLIRVYLADLRRAGANPLVARFRGGAAPGKLFRLYVAAVTGRI